MTANTVVKPAADLVLDVTVWPAQAALREAALILALAAAALIAALAV